ncbi:glycosylphosphatidylinositol anchor attachment 1 protein-like [Mytilus californianus]|uniref:glycosylphosphatidylinositol anchor attachment 1 protein-like n=1 Tax=Mytilus californianus TaxID=6549 RepID=UPI0022480CCB|nr:glycosylphosphatidylinositol anchor attachment 1 protein-like [Mytilus californianus]
MGLLSDPKKRQKILDVISKYNNHLSVLCYIAGVTWFLALAYQPLNARTYFSENALLPGLVENEFYPELDMESLVQEYNEQLQKEKNNVPRKWVADQFIALGLDTYIQNYTILYPLQLTRGKSVPGQNVYGILRARRASSTESIVLSMPLRQKESDMPSTTGSMVLMLALAKYFRQKPYWAKDIIFLATDHEQFGMQAWLNGYHDISSDYISPGDLMGRSGSIQAALNLEIPDSNLKHLDIKIQGLNGQLPNLDLVNLVVRLCQRERVEVSIHKQKDYYDAESVDGYKHSLKTMMKMMWSHASGVPTGNHGLFHRYHIEAVTIEGITKRKGHHISLAKTGRVIEGIFRSLNNLLERFHQSFFFYILPATERYISIGLYMPPFGLICAAGLIKAVAIWIALSTRNSENITSDSENKTSDSKNNTSDSKEEKESEAKEEKEDTKQTDTDNEDEDSPEEASREGVSTVLPLILFSFLMGVFCFTGPEFVTTMSPSFRIGVEDTVFFGLLALFSACLLLPRTVAKKSQSSDKRLIFDWELLKSIGLIFQSLVLFSISLMNISLAFFLAVFIIPVTVITHPCKNRIFCWLQKILLLLLCPAVQICIASMISTMEGRYKGSWDLIQKSFESMKHGLVLTILDRYLFGSWMYGLFCFTVLPTWLMFWTIVHCDL